MTTNAANWATYDTIKAEVLAAKAPEPEWNTTPYHSSAERDARQPRRIKGSFTKAHKPKRIAWARWLREAKRREMNET